MPHRPIWHSIPVLPFDKRDPTLEFYGRLGFDIGHEDSIYLMLRKDQVEVHLALLGHHFVRGPTTCYFRTPDVDLLFERLEMPEEAIIAMPQDMPWRMREFHLRDPFGNVLRFGQPSTE
jgi:uncharacterized glyoxalase superfamily protein PhnB